MNEFEATAEDLDRAKNLPCASHEANLLRGG